MQLRFDWWRWLVTVLVGFLILLMMCGCRTTRYVEVEKTVKDTASYARWDSVANERVRVVRDSLLKLRFELNERYVRDSTYIKEDVKVRVDDKGNVLGKDSIRIEVRYRDSKELANVKDSLIRYKEIADSSMVYKEKRDSLQRLMSSLEKEKVYVEKELHGIDLLYFRIGKFLFWTSMYGIAGLFLLFIIRRFSNHIG